ncbi:membrane protein, partial [Streptomyces sp. 150FB]|uniref:FtsX-like permease family protein n=1 Tax=Streptomyces sp. 150FB TaxID=1576605 RepID=UPI0005893B4A
CAVTALACAALPVRAVVAHRGTQTAGGREDLIGAKPSRRRTVAELTALVLAVGAVVALRRRGTGSGGEADVLVSSAPVLVGLIAALVLGRLYPLPLRLLARPAGRLRGAVGFVALSRAGRSSATGALPLLALLVALTTTAFGGSVLAGIGDARDQAALLATGADARVAGVTDAMELPRAAVEAVRRGTGVRDVAPVRIEHGVTLPGTGTGNTPNVTLIGADPASYARLAGRTGLGAFSEGLLAPKGTGGGGGSGGAVPAIASPAVAARLGGVGGGPHTVSALSGRLSVRIVAVESRTPGAPDSGYLLVDADALTKRGPTTLLVTGDRLDAGALRKAAPGFTVKLRGEARSVYLDSPLQSGAERIYAAAIAAGAGYAVLALLLSLSQSAPERTTLLARLRTMGLTGKQGRRLLELEALPPALLAAVGGALVGWATIALLAPGVDLTRLALSAAPGSDPTGSLATFGTVTLRTDLWSLLVPGAGVLALAAAVALVQARWAGRRGSINGPRE